MVEQHMIGGWVFEQNLRPFIETVAALAAYEFDEDDWIGVEYGLFKTPLLPDQRVAFVDYAWSGVRPTTIRLTYEPGTSVVEFELSSDQDLEARADSVAYIMETYDVRRRN